MRPRLHRSAVAYLPRPRPGAERYQAIRGDSFSADSLTIRNGIDARRKAPEGHNEKRSCGIQPAHKSVIGRRLKALSPALAEGP